MTINQKIQALLTRIHSKSIDKPINISIYFSELQIDTNESIEIVKRLEDDGFIKSAVDYGNNYIYITPEGQKVGRYNNYSDIITSRENAKISFIEKEKLQIERDKKDQFQKNANLLITIISALGTLVVSIWNTTLNTDMSDVLQSMESVKIKMDSIRLEMKFLRDSINKNNNGKLYDFPKFKAKKKNI